MIQYMVILLDDMSISYCHYKNLKTERYLMPLDILRKGIRYGMKENLGIQFVLPEYSLPEEYWKEMMSINHSIIMSGNMQESVPKHLNYQVPQVIVYDSIDKFLNNTHGNNHIIVLRLSKNELFDNVKVITGSLFKLLRLNIVITDLYTFTEDDLNKYRKCLEELVQEVRNVYLQGHMPQINIVTDRMMLKQMNNCNAGSGSITLAPDGKFYVCPAFYQDDAHTQICDGFDIGSLLNGLQIRNQRLYELQSAPLCRRCDAYQCKRCIWLNYKTTYEVNTPSHEQCVISHIERNISRKLLQEMRDSQLSFLSDIDIQEIDYLDPFDEKDEL